MDDKKTKDEELTPIIDGDARPDHQEEALKSNEELKEKKKKKTFTHERGADINTLEDFKDAK